MANHTPFNSYTDGVEYLKNNGKTKDNKFKLEKSQYREFMELAGAPKPVQEAYNKADAMLRKSVHVLGTDMLRDELLRKKGEGATKEELGDTKVELTVLGDASNIRSYHYGKKENRVPQTNEITTKYGSCRMTVEVRRSGVTAEDIAYINNEFNEIINGK